jgi:hypothetical protein
MTRALVTGAGGFVGRHLCARLVADGWAGVGTVARAPRSGGRARAPVDLTGPFEVPPWTWRSTSAAARARASGARRGGERHVGVHLVEALPPSCRAVVRLGSSTSTPRRRPDGGGRAAAPRGFFGAPRPPGRCCCRRGGRARAALGVLRAFQVTGPRQAVPLRPAVLRAAPHGDVLPLTRSGLRRDWVHVDDVVEACLLAAARDDLPPGPGAQPSGPGCRPPTRSWSSFAREVTGRGDPHAVGAHAWAVVGRGSGVATVLAARCSAGSPGNCARPRTAPGAAG